jgi:hypothetical protein
MDTPPSCSGPTLLQDHIVRLQSAGRASPLVCGAQKSIPPPAGMGRRRLRLAGNRCLRRDDQVGDRGGILKRRPNDLDQIDNAGLEHGLVFGGRGVEAPSAPGSSS